MSCIVVLLFAVWSENDGIFRHSVIHVGINLISLKRLNNQMQDKNCTVWVSEINFKPDPDNEGSVRLPVLSWREEIKRQGIARKYDYLIPKNHIIIQSVSVHLQPTTAKTATVIIYTENSFF